MSISSLNRMTVPSHIDASGSANSYQRVQERATSRSAEADTVVYPQVKLGTGEKSIREGNSAHGITPRPAEPATSPELSSTDESPLLTSIKHTLSGDAQGNVHEEELQHALVVHLLEESHPEALAAYLEAFNQVILHASAEDSVKEALKKVVEEGLLTTEVAEEINGMSFQAAQLDDNLTMLFDNRGGGSDSTIAVRGLDDAILRAESTLEKLQSGELTLESRSLEAPSNGTGGVSASGTAQFGDGFLWKPSSDRDGKLVVLFPPELSGSIESASIYSEVPPTTISLIESGRFSGDQHNGGRAHFRFTRPGSSYPDGVYVVAQLRDGTHVQFRIGETSQRNE